MRYSMSRASISVPQSSLKPMMILSTDFAYPLGLTWHTSFRLVRDYKENGVHWAEIEKIKPNGHRGKGTIQAKSEHALTCRAQLPELVADKGYPITAVQFQTITKGTRWRIEIPSSMKIWNSDAPLVKKVPDGQVMSVEQSAPPDTGYEPPLPPKVRSREGLMEYYHELRVAGVSEAAALGLIERWWQ